MAGLPTADALWAQRLHRSLGPLDNSERQQEYRRLMREICCVLGQESSIVDGHWAPNPHYRDPARERELWEQIGELLGIGPPPAGWSAMRGVPRREPEGALPSSSS